MKKVYSVLFAIAMISMVSCGSNQKDKAKMEAEEKTKMDSIFNAANKNMAAADSVHHTDSTAKAK